ncbi:MAG TPA: Rieske (2Fe-2S) protein [Polyangiaceae bacterium]|jgi:Rieske Fe-S protein
MTHDPKEKPEGDTDDAEAGEGALITRRRFARAVLGTATAGYSVAIAYPVTRYLLSGAEIADEGTQVSEVSIGKADDLNPRSGKNFAFGSRPALIVRDAGGNFAAFLATCTHLGCTVALDPKAFIIRCPCHGGTYDPMTGKNIGGPPPKPLEPLHAVIETDKLVVRKRKA